ncbi:MAG TPA: carbohydrate ABC transporter permease [Clostridiales bacterium]|nr:carbohydrate ABC transporter permease [Clostridiales bacterium]
MNQTNVKGIKSGMVHGRKSAVEWIFDSLNLILILLAFAVFLYPFWNQLVLSFNVGTDAAKGGIYFWPRKFSLDNYTYVLGVTHFFRSVLYSILRVVVGTFGNLFCCGLLGYVLAQKSFSGSRFMRTVTVLSMYIPIGLIPIYVLYSNLKLLDSFTVYWLPGLITGWNVLMITSFVESQPVALFESARLDGASELTVFTRIVFPICKPVFAALAIITAVNHWNSWFDVLVYNPSGNFDTLQMVLQRLLIKADIAKDLMNQNNNPESYKLLTPITIRAATTMIVTIPIAAVYPFFQRYFVGGLSLGAVKG